MFITGLIFVQASNTNKH